MQVASSAAALTNALTLSRFDPDHEPRIAAHHVDRLWRREGGDWKEPQVVAALVAGVAQLAWHGARSHANTPLPPFAVILAARPRCLRILLPDDSRHFGVVIVWLRHFEALLPLGAPACHLVLAPRIGAVAEPHEGQWLWGCAPATLHSFAATSETREPGAGAPPHAEPQTLCALHSRSTHSTWNLKPVKVDNLFSATLLVCITALFASASVRAVASIDPPRVMASSVAPGGTKAH